MNKYFVIILLFFFIAVGVLDGGKIFAAMTSTGGYEIWADEISVGGLSPSVSESSYNLMDTLGDLIAGESSSTNYVSKQGFQEMIKGLISLSISPNSIDFGQLDSAIVKSGSTAITFYSDGSSGARVYFTGNTLTGDEGAVAAIGASATNSSPGTSQFGFNAIYASGDTNAQSISPYNLSANYAFQSGDDIISTASAMATASVFDLNFIANISGTEPAGSYSTALTFTAIGSF